MSRVTLPYRKKIGISQERKDLIRKIRTDEERPLKNYGIVIQKMKAVIIVYRNISMDIKNSIKEMEEHLDLIIHQRSFCKTAQEEPGKKQIGSAVFSCTKFVVPSPPKG